MSQYVISFSDDIDTVASGEDTLWNEVSFLLKLQE
jgi:hypothetical protein